MVIGMLKLKVARLLLSLPIGKAIAGLYQNRIPFDGMRIWTDEGSLQPSTKAALFWGLYEKSERLMIARYLPQDVPVIELGASIGGITNVIRRRLNDDTPMISVEANPLLLPLIKKSLAENCHGGHVDVIHAAISYGPGEIVAFSIDPVSTNSKVAKNEHAKNVLHVPQLSLAQIVRNSDLKRYSIVCDIEGGGI
jgi:FkbM family methyltransferase